MGNVEENKSESLLQRIKNWFERMMLAVDAFLAREGSSISLNLEPIPTIGFIPTPAAQESRIVYQGRASAPEAQSLSQLKRDLMPEVSRFQIQNETGERTISIIRKTPENSLPARRDRSDVQISREVKRQEIIAGLPSTRSIAGGRVSMENPAIMAGGIDAYSQFSRNQYWQQASMSSRFNTDNFSKVNLAELAELLTELSPEVSGALWYYLLCCNSGYEINVYTPGTTTVNVRAKAYLDQCLKTLGSYHGTLNTFFDKTFMAIFMRGSFLYELVLQENGKDFADIAAPDTKTLFYKRAYDDIRGQIWDFGQFQQGSWVSLNIPTIRYVPLHPLPGRIEGRPMISPVFFTAIFLMSVLRDLKRVIQQQGYMRLDLSVDFQKLEKAIPAEAENDPKIFKTWADGVMADVDRYYGQLEPDDAYIHADSVTVNKPAGTADMTSLAAMDSLFNILERMSVRALKTLPALLGMDTHGNQASDNRKFEFYQKGNETVQRMVESAFGDECKMVLQAGGFQADVVVKFAQMRASEELRDAQVAMLKAQIAKFKYDAGWISQDEAAKDGASMETADQQAPRVATAAANVGNLITAQPDPGINRFALLGEMLRNPTMFEVTSAMQLWKENAPEEAKELISAVPMN